jgi:hypothetical protein
MILDQGRDLEVVDADIAENPVQLTGIPKMRELGPEHGTLPDLATRARDTRPAAPEQGLKPGWRVTLRFLYGLAHCLLPNAGGSQPLLFQLMGAKNHSALIQIKQPGELQESRNERRLVAERTEAIH